MGKLTLLLVAAAALSTSILYRRAADVNAASAAADHAVHTDLAAAREIALTGHAAAARAALDALFGGGLGVGTRRAVAPYAGGRYDATARTTLQRVTVTSEGTDGARAYRIGATYAIEYEPPAALQHAFFVDDNLELRDAVVIRARNAAANANLHANGHLTVGGDGTLVNGFGTHVAGATNDTRSPWGALFTPPDNPEGRPPVHAAPRLVMPPFSARSFMLTADRLTLGVLTLSGTVRLGTQEDPVVWFVEGSVRTDGPVTFEGYGAIVSTGSVDLGHPVLAAEGPTSAVGFFTDNNVLVTRSALDVHAQLFAMKNVELERDTHLHGSLAAGWNTYLRGALRIEHVPPAPEVTGLIWPSAGGLLGGGVTGLRLLDWSEGEELD